MEDELNISKVEYISDHLLGHTQTLNLSFDDITMFSNPKNEEDLFYKSLKLRQPHMKEVLKNIKSGIFDKSRGKLRGNLKCGSAHPSLFSFVKSPCLYYTKGWGNLKWHLEFAFEHETRLSMIFLNANFKQNI
jgi:hypothetical protein